MKERLTRRQIAGAFAAAAALRGQTPAPAAQSAQDELKAATDRNCDLADQLAKFPVAMAVEPAVHFKP